VQHFSEEGDTMLYFCPCGECNSSPSEALLEALDECRDMAGIPFIVTSGPRCEAHNEHVGGSQYSAHLDGDAADIKATDSHSRFVIVKAAIECGFNRIGIARSFVHLDVSESNSQEVVWLY